MRALKWLAGILAALVVLVVVLAFVLPRLIDPEAYRERIVAAVEGATGRSLELQGELGWSVLPRLALSAGSVRLGNDPAFPGDAFLAARELSASVALLPLITGEIRVGEVRLEGVALDLTVNAAGRGNWESLVARLAGDAGRASTGQRQGDAPPDLAIEALRLVDASIRYEELGAGLTARLDELSVLVSPVAAGEVTTVEVAMRYAVQDLEGTLVATATAEGLLAAAEDPAPRFTIRSLRLGSTGEPAFTAVLEDHAVVDLGTGELALPGLAVRSGEARLTVEAAGSGLPDAPVIAGRLVVPTFDLGAWLAARALYTGQTRDPDALERLSLETRFRLADSALTLSALTGRLDDSTLSGTIGVGERITFELVLDRLDLDRYLPPAAAEGAPGEPTPAPTLAFGAIDGSLEVGHFRLSGLEAEDIRLVVTSDADGLRVAPLEGEFYGGTIDAELRLAAAGARTPTSVVLDVASVQAGDLLQAWMARPVMTGRGRLSARLTLADALAAAPLEGLEGELSFAFRDGALFGIDVLGVLRRALERVGRGGEEGNVDAAGERTTFSSLDFAGTIAGGVLSTDAFRLVSPLLEVDGSGTVDLAAGTLDYRLVPELLKLPADEDGLLSRLSGRRIPLRLAGALGAPRVLPDLAGATGEAIRRRLGEKLGLDDETQADERALLEGLLRGALERRRREEPAEADDGGL